MPGLDIRDEHVQSEQNHHDFVETDENQAADNSPLNELRVPLIGDWHPPACINAAAVAGPGPSYLNAREDYNTQTYHSDRHPLVSNTNANSNNSPMHGFLVEHMAPVRTLTGH